MLITCCLWLPVCNNGRAEWLRRRPSEVCPLLFTGHVCPGRLWAGRRGRARKVSSREAAPPNPSRLVFPSLGVSHQLRDCAAPAVSPASVRQGRLCWASWSLCPQWCRPAKPCVWVCECERVSLSVWTPSIAYNSVSSMSGMGGLKPALKFLESRGETGTVYSITRSRGEGQREVEFWGRTWLI